MNDKMLKVTEVMEVLNVKKSTAYEKIREINELQKKKNKHINLISGRVSEKALKEYYGLS